MIFGGTFLDAGILSKIRLGSGEGGGGGLFAKPLFKSFRLSTIEYPFKNFGTYNVVETNPQRKKLV